MDGIVFASKKEMNRYAELLLVQRAGQISDLRLQPKLSVEINGQHFCSYTPDFAYQDRDRGLTFEELKSTGTAKDAAYKLRRKAAELTHGITVREVIR